MTTVFHPGETLVAARDIVARSFVDSGVAIQRLECSRFCSLFPDFRALSHNETATLPAHRDRAWRDSDEYHFAGTVVQRVPGNTQSSTSTHVCDAVHYVNHAHHYLTTRVPIMNWWMLQMY